MSVVTVLLSLCLLEPVFAYHGSAPHFDSDDVVSLEGIVTEFNFVNPHSFVHFDVVEADGSTTAWRCELSGASQLGRFGWSGDTLSSGQEIRIVGDRARRESNACDTRSLHLADGTNLSRDIYVQGAAREERVADATDSRSRPPYLANGQPNLSGGWIVREGGGAIDGPPLPTPAGLTAGENYDVRFDNPVLHCESGNIVWDWARQGHINEILQQETQIILRYGYLDLTRTVYLDLQDHPENLVPSLEGHSIGWWDNDSLVVDTTSFLPRVLVPRAAIMTSSELYVVERFSFDGATGTLVREYTATDPHYLAQPYRGRDIADVSLSSYQPFNCVDLSGENNTRPE